MVLDDPVGFFRYKRAQHGGGELTVRVRSQLIANIVQQCGNDHFGGLIGTQCVGSRLQRMLQSGDLIAAKRVVEIFQCIYNSIRQCLVVLIFESAQHGVLFYSAVFHLRKFNLFHRNSLVVPVEEWLG